MSSGLSRNNPLNIKGGGWQGQIARDERGHAVFTNMAYGTRAAIVLLRTYWFTHGLTTVAAILSRWAPATDTVGSLKNAPPNSPNEYSEFVCSRMRGGEKPNTPLALFNDDKSIRNRTQLKELVQAMAAYEIGGGYKLPDETFDDAVKLV